MKTIEQELRDWLRPMSPLTAFAKSLRNEGGGNQDDPSKAGKGEYIDPFKDEDLSELPQDTRDKLEKLRKDHEATFKSNVELEQRRQQAEQFARTQQSEKDRALGVLRAHNLDPAAKPAAKNLSDAKFQQLVEKFRADGLTKEGVAESYAKMFITAGDIQREEILREVAGPMAANLNNMQAQQHLLAAQSQFKDVFAVPELAKQIHDNLNALLTSGQPIQPNTIKHLASMAWGEYTLANPDVLKKGKEKEVKQEIPQFGSALSGGGGHRNNLQQQQEGKGPQATQSETVSIVGALNQLWAKDIQALGGGKKGGK